MPKANQELPPIHRIFDLTDGPTRRAIFGHRLSWEDEPEEKPAKKQPVEDEE